MILMRICLCIVFDSSYSHFHTLLITCTCCYDLTKGTQDKDFSYSFSILSLWFSLSCWFSLAPSRFSFSCSHLSCCYDEIKGTQDQDLFSCWFSRFSLWKKLKTSSSILMLILSVSLCVALWLCVLCIWRKRRSDGCRAVHGGSGLQNGSTPVVVYVWPSHRRIRRCDHTVRARQHGVQCQRPIVTEGTRFNCPNSAAFGTARATVTSCFVASPFRVVVSSSIRQIFAAVVSFISWSVANLY